MISAFQQIPSSKKKIGLVYEPGKNLNELRPLKVKVWSIKKDNTLRNVVL
jgi:hypothetical protein